MTSSLDIKIANAKRRAAEEKAAFERHGKRATPPMNAADVKMIKQDVAKALEKAKASTVLAVGPMLSLGWWKAQMAARKP